jgi:hypothetical protein
VLQQVGISMLPLAMGSVGVVCSDTGNGSAREHLGLLLLVVAHVVALRRAAGHACGGLVALVVLLQTRWWTVAHTAARAAPKRDEAVHDAVAGSPAAVGAAAADAVHRDAHVAEAMSWLLLLGVIC